jgi:SAM-dependent methyltransferase
VNRWDERYDHERFFYGRAPNYFVAEQVRCLAGGRGLYLAEGEGRNAVFAAGLGHEVVAVDSSAVGRRKALELAGERGVHLTYHVADIVLHPWHRERWDHAVLCFAHLPPEDMAGVHRRVAASLKPGGTLVFTSFSKAQFGRTSGGPPRLEWLHDLAELPGQFPGLEFTHAVEREVDLAESVGHHGAAMVIEMVGVRPGGDG